MNKNRILIGSFVSIKLIIHLLGNNRYGFHRDELLHLSVSEHLAWGYMEFPPFISWMGKLSDMVFDHSLWGTRLLPTISGIIMLAICCQIILEFKGSFYALLLGGLCFLAYVPFYRNHTLFQPVAFNQLFWALGFYYLIRLAKTRADKYFYFLAVVCGFGVLNKYTFVIWILSALLGLVFIDRGSLLKRKHLYFAFALIILMVLPNLMWQVSHEYPILKHLEALNKSQLEDLGVFDFVLAQFDSPFTFLFACIGIFGFLFVGSFKEYRSIGISALILFLILWFFKSKAYYVFGIYTLLFALGAIVVDSIVKNKIVKISFAFLIFVPSLYFIPEAIPILPIETYVKYKNLETEKADKIRYKLTSDFADMFGWEEQVQLIDSVYKSLPKNDRTNCVLWAENYGEAGALKILGDRYGLPDPISRHGSFWLWGYGNPNAKVWITLGNEKESVESVFKEVTLVRKINHPYAIDEEVNIPVYICRKPKVDIRQWWSDYKDHVFD